jgi:hypothetical protein
MKFMTSPLPALEGLGEHFPQLSLLVLHGSRARGDSHAGSDWDFAYLAGPELDALSLRAALVRTLGTDRVDIADLARAGGVLRYAVASEGQPTFERTPGAFERFAIDAVHFWLDVEPIVRSATNARPVAIDRSRWQA